ncbi:MAG TPA: hypothetical protein VFL14_13855 [Xanthomonadales bacterium]|nr:hypothetical protein [Xanthomonadales bacterium]
MPVHADAELPGFVRAARVAPPATRVEPPVAQWSSVAWFDDAQRTFACEAGAHGLRVRFEGHGELLLGADDVLHVDGMPAHATHEALLGVGLVLALAQRGCFALHAACVLDPRDRAFVLLGASGAGKSTLAALLAAQGGWRRLCDDITPATCDAAGTQLWPSFPQLKLEPSQWSRDTRLIAPAALLVLARDAGCAAPVLRPLDATAAAVLLLRRTAGTRLFAPDLLAEHLWFARCAAQSVPAFALSVPDDLPHIARTAVRTAALLDAWRP